MGWVTFATLHDIHWRVEEDPRILGKVYRFKKDDKRLDYYIPLKVLGYRERRVLEAELLRVLRGLVNA